jgi:hypothetical protein
MIRSYSRYVLRVGDSLWLNTPTIRVIAVGPEYLGIMSELEIVNESDSNHYLVSL